MGQDEVELRNGSRSTSLTIDGDRAAAHALLEELTNPNSPVWHQIAADETAPLRDLVEDLDRMGWVREGADDGLQRHREKARRLEVIRESAEGWLAEQGADAVTQRSDNLAALVLASCREAWERWSPLTATVLRQVLDRVDADGGWDEAAMAVGDMNEVAREVSAALQLDCLSRLAELEPRFVEFVPGSLPDGPGINLLIEAEQRAEALLEALGASELIALVERPGGVAAAAPMVYQHRWYETIRYVDAAAGLLSCQLGSNLRSLVVAYLQEEMGHEVHEASTCRDLGVTDRDLAEFAPLAWLAAYPVLLATLARERPLSFLLSVTVAEGLPGSGRRLSDRMADLGLDAPTAVDHDEIDRRLNHEMVTRTMFAEIEWIDGEVGCRAVADFLQIVELTHRAWQLLGRLVVAGVATSPRPFEIRPEQLRLAHHRGGGE